MNLTAKALMKEFPRKSGSANCFTVLQPLDLTIDAGKLTVLMGRSGSGKSTLLNILGGLLRPTDGKVLAGEADLYEMPDKALSAFRNRHIGIIPQGQTALYSLTVEENILLPVTLTGKADDAAKQRVQTLAKALEITALLGCYPAELSGGELRRMAIARALLPQPEILLADEPTSDLDEETTQLVLRILKEAAAQGSAVLMVTHDPCAKEFADILLSMRNGVIAADAE